MSLSKNRQTIFVFYCIIFCIFIFIGSTHPFLRYPYDEIAHMIAIDEIYHGAERTSTTIQNSRLVWHKIWAEVFSLFDIDSTQFLLRTKIIHTIQTMIAFFSIYFFSLVILRNLFVQAPRIVLQYLSLWSVVLWFTIFSTFSLHYHLIWNLWYSLNYQITLPLFFYIVALTFILILEKQSNFLKVFYIIQVLLLSKFILQAHAMEFLYYLMYLLVFLLLFWKTVFQVICRYYYLFILLLGVLLYLLNSVEFDSSRFLKYIGNGSFSALYEDSLLQGEIVISHYNRARFVINEIMYLSFFSALCTLVIYSVKQKLFQNIINMKMFIFVLITSLFLIIPLYQFPAGIFALITKVHVVHRVYYSASIFLLLPIFVYTLSLWFKWRLLTINTVLLIFLIGVYSYSKQVSVLHHNFYKNIQSIKNSMGSTYNFHLSQKDIKRIGEQIVAYEKKNNTGKDIFYFARPDIAFVIKYIYHKRVYWHNRRANIKYKERYNDYVNIRKYERYKYVLFDDRSFPKYTVKDFYK